MIQRLNHKSDEYNKIILEVKQNLLGVHRSWTLNKKLFAASGLGRLSHGGLCHVKK